MEEGSPVLSLSTMESLNVSEVTRWRDRARLVMLRRRILRQRILLMVDNNQSHDLLNHDHKPDTMLGALNTLFYLTFMTTQEVKITHIKSGKSNICLMDSFNHYQNM